MGYADGMRTVLISLMLFAASSAHAACPGHFARLEKLAGGPASKVIEDPAVSARLAGLMGTETAHLKANLSVTGPVALIDCELVVEGNAPHQGGVQNAILSFDLYRGILTTALLDNDKIYVRSAPHPFRQSRNYSHLPAHVRDWISVAASQFRSRGLPPSNLVWVSTPKR